MRGLGLSLSDNLEVCLRSGLGGILSPDTMASAQPIPSDLLLAHSGFLRDLARGVLMDEAAAEDVVQETWIVALERPPGTRAALRGWLATVARNLALRRLRGEGRRMARERASARPEAEEVQGREQILRSVVDAVLALEEPYRTTVLLRYFEGLPPREIARRQGVPVTTVKSRLKRGHDRLRTSLRGEFGGEDRAWCSALAALAGLRDCASSTGFSAWTAAALAGALAMGLKAKVGIAALLLGVLMFGAWRTFGTAPALELADGDPGSTLSAAELRPDKDSAALVVGAEPASNGEGRVSVEAPTPVPVQRFEFEVRGYVHDDEGRPVAALPIAIGPGAQILNDAGYTDRTGHFRVRWHGKQSTANVVLAAGQIDEGAGNLRELALLSGMPVELDVVHVGMAAPALLGMLAHAEADSRATYRALRLGYFTSLGGSHPPLVLDENGIGTFRARPEPMSPSRRIEYQQAQEDFQIQMDLVEDLRRMEEEIIDSREVKDDEPEPAVVSGVVQDVFGTPTAGMLVRLELGKWYEETRTDENGRYRIEGDAGRFKLVAGSPGHGLAEAVYETKPGEEIVWDAWLQHGNVIEGFLMRSDDEALAGWRIEVVTPGPAPSWSASATTDESGGFRVTNCPDVALDVYVHHQPFPYLVARGVRPGGEALALELTDERLTKVPLTIQVLDPEGAALTKGEVRLWHVDSGKGLRVVWHPTAEAFAMPGVQPGVYTLEAGAPGHEWSSRTTLTVLEGDEYQDLGALQLAGPGRLDFDLDTSSLKKPEALRWSLYLERDDATSIVLTDAEPPEEPYELAPGHYRLRLHGEDIQPFEHELDVRSGAETPLTHPVRPIERE